MTKQGHNPSDETLRNRESGGRRKHLSDDFCSRRLRSWPRSSSRSNGNQEHTVFESRQKKRKNANAPKLTFGMCQVTHSKLDQKLGVLVVENISPHHDSHDYFVKVDSRDTTVALAEISVGAEESVTVTLPGFASREKTNSRIVLEYS